MNSQDNAGRTALHYACILGDIESYKNLVDANARIDIEDSQGMTAHDYLEYTDEEAIIKETLASVSVDCYRDEGAVHNCFHKPTHRPVDQKAATKKAFVKLKNTKRLEPQIEKYYALQGAELTGKSLLYACKFGKGEIETYIGNKFATAGTFSFFLEDDQGKKLPFGTEVEIHSSDALSLRGVKYARIIGWEGGKSCPSQQEDRYVLELSRGREIRINAANMKGVKKIASATTQAAIAPPKPNTTDGEMLGAAGGGSIVSTKPAVAAPRAKGGCELRPGFL